MAWIGALTTALFVKLITAGIALPVVIAKKAGKIFTKDRIMALIIITGLLDGTGFLFYNNAINLIGVSLVAPIASASPALAVALGIIFLGERPNFRQKIGIVITLIGLILIVI